MARKMISTYVHVEVQRGENERIATTVLAHEIPCLVATHGEGSVHVIKDVPKDILDYSRIGKEVELDRDEEWGRLVSKYGMHPTHNMETVVFVFQNDRKRMATFDLDEFITDMEGEINNEGVEEMLDMLEELDIEVDSERPAKVEAQLRQVLCEQLSERDVPFDSNADIKTLIAVAKAVLSTTVSGSVKSAVKNVLGGNKKNVDKDGNGNINKDEIKEKLDLLDVGYKVNDDKPTLLSLLAEELKSLLEEYELSFEEDEAVEVLWSKVQDHENSIMSGSNE